MTRDEFQKFVAEAVDGIDDEEMTWLTDHLLVARGAILMWARGTASPHPAVHDKIIRIFERFKKFERKIKPA
jgi:hypothetical protein